jgi:hypothetical protein
MMDQFQKIKGADGSVAEEADCKVSSKCLARTCDNGSVPEKIRCKVGEKLVNKTVIMDQLQKKKPRVQCWQQGCMARELDNGSISSETN